MAETKRKKETVKMFGNGNFIIGKTLYVFTDGEEVEVKIKAQKKILEAEAIRRKAVADRRNSLESAQRA